jgi:hypothetical protein
MIAELIKSEPNVLAGLCYVCMILTKELESSWKGFLFVLKCLMVFAEIIIADSNIIIALRNFNMAFAK